MKQHRKGRGKKVPARQKSPDAVRPAEQSGFHPARSGRGLVLAGVLILGVAALAWFFNGAGNGQSEVEKPPPKTAPEAPQPQVAQRKEPGPTVTPPSTPHQPPEKFLKEPGGSFLDAFGGKDTGGDLTGVPVLSNEELETKFKTLTDARERFKTYQSRLKAVRSKVELDNLVKESEKLAAQVDEQLASLHKELAQARQARAADPVPQWLTGELLIYVGGDPMEITPYLQRAVEGGLNRPRLFASLARTYLEDNRLQAAHDLGVKAITGAPQDPDAWRAFANAAFCLEQFAPIIDRMDHNFPETRPAWLTPIRARAIELLALWSTERKLRETEAAADNLPRVRLTIEHRRYLRDARGNTLPTIENTGKGEVVIELFEDQAPVAVANFITLVSQKVYDGTRFYLGEPHALVAGGDPKSRTGEAADDGTGGPGYTIPDEHGKPGARCPFRGSIGMVNTGPNTAGSQFFITLAPMLEMNGRFTVFGRVIEGMDTVDRISRGRTNPQVGRFGRIIPGDLLLRAEILRKRPHEYRVTRASGR